MSESATLTPTQHLQEKLSKATDNHRQKPQLTPEEVQEVRRRNLKPWKPGQSGNLKGRPKAKYVFSDCLRAIAQQKVKGKAKRQGLTHMQSMALTAFERAEAGNIEAIKLVVERTEGKVPDSLQLTGNMGHIDINKLLEAVRDDPERARALANTLRTSITDSAGT